jgi:hypothetical protein
MEAFVHGPEELLTTTASWNPPRADPDLFLSKSISFLHTTRDPISRNSTTRPTVAPRSRPPTKNRHRTNRRFTQENDHEHHLGADHRGGRRGVHHLGSHQVQLRPSRLLVARSRILWGDRVHGFYQVAGALLIIAGAAIALTGRATKNPTLRHQC